MHKTLRICRLTLKEALSRRVIPAAVAASVVYLVLFAVAYNFAQERGTQAVTGARSRMLVGMGMASLTLSGLYIVNLLAGFLALFVSVGAISADVDSGVLHALLARPVRRSQLLLGRWLAYALLMALYVSAMSSVVLVIAAMIGGYQAPNPTAAIGLMILAELFLLTLGVLGSTFLPTLTNGAVVFTLFALGWLSGVIEVIGSMQQNPALLDLGGLIAIVIPSDALWRSASYFVQSASILAGSAALNAVVPLLANTPPTPFLVIWGVAYPLILLATATFIFSRRDL